MVQSADRSRYLGFGYSLTSVNDVDRNGTRDVVVAWPAAVFGNGGARGAVWLLLLNPDGSVRRTISLSHSRARPAWNLSYRMLGSFLANAGDLNGDGLDDLVVSDGYTPHEPFLIEALVAGPWIIFMSAATNDAASALSPQR